MRSASGLRWIAVGVMLAVGVLLLLIGVGWGALLAGLALLGFVAAAWIDVRPQGGHVHDSGLSAYGVADSSPELPRDLTGYG